ncbi:HAMP domain-containing sensor histidine kinase [Chitinophaga sp. 212800008-4]|uniref:sensor histidine kinase n=1 Tax=unclassified Chitinophaga TaxID=2619133 RepID=UPI0030CE8AC2
MFILLIGRRILLLIAVVLLMQQASAQLSAIRRLQHELPQLADSNAYVNTLNQLGLLFYLKSWDSCIYYARQARDIAERQHYKSGIAGALNVFGIFHMSENSYLATKYMNESLQLYTELDDSSNIAQLYNNLGMIFYFEGNLNQTLSYVRKADEISRHLQHDSIRSLIVANLTEMDSTLSVTQIDSMRTLSIFIARKYKDSLLLEELRLTRILTAFIREKSKANIDSMLNILEMYEKEENNFRLAVGYAVLADGMLITGDKSAALTYYNKALEKATTNANYPLRTMMLEKLMHYYASVNNTAKAYEYAVLLLEAKDKLNERLKNSGYTYANFVSNEKDLQLAAEKSAEQKKIIVISTILLVLFLVLLIVLLRSYKITRRAKVVQEQLAAVTQQRNARLESWDQFNRMLLGIMAHDLRQPFGTVVSFIDMMKQGIALTKEENNVIMDGLRETSMQSIQFIDGLLAWVKSKREDFAYHPVPVSVQDAVQQANVFFVSDQQKKNVELNASVEPASLAVSADRTMLLFILRNLLSNATKYAPPGSHITVAAEQHNRAVKLSVADEGMGMSPEAVTRLFTLGQNDAVKTDTLKGAGLALVISYDMVKQMQGKLTVESEKGAGTVFRLELPC